MNLVLAGKYEDRFAQNLQPGEFLLNAGKGIEIIREDETGQNGDAFLGVTNRHVWIVYEDGKNYALTFAEIESIRVQRVRTVVPRVRQIQILQLETLMPVVKFHGGKSLADELNTLVPIQQLVSGLVKVPPFEPLDPAEWIKAGLTGGMLGRGKTLDYLDRYKKARDGADATFLDFIPLLSTSVDSCVTVGNLFAKHLAAIRLQQFDPKLKEIYVAGEVPRLRNDWNPYSKEEIASLVSRRKASHKELLLDWYYLKHDLLEASFRSAWHLTRHEHYEEARAVLTLGLSLSNGSDRLVLQRVNEIA